MRDRCQYEVIKQLGSSSSRVRWVQSTCVVQMPENSRMETYIIGFTHSVDLLSLAYNSLFRSQNPAHIELISTDTLAILLFHNINNYLIRNCYPIPFDFCICNQNNLFRNNRAEMDSFCSLRLTKALMMPQTGTLLTKTLLASFPLTKPLLARRLPTKTLSSLKATLLSQSLPN